VPAAGHAGLNAPIPKLIAKARLGERLAIIVHQERQVASDGGGLAGVYDPLQLGRHGDVHHHGVAVPVLLLGVSTPARVLFAEHHDVGRAGRRSR
jgi:hypothetical protein